MNQLLPVIAGVRCRSAETSGVAYLELVAITLARVHFKSLDDLARATGEHSTALLDTAEVHAGTFARRS